MDKTFETNLFNNLMDQWILPSIRERQESGELEKPLALSMAQIIFKPDGGKPEVRINAEIKGRAIVNLKEGLNEPLKAGDQISLNQLDGIEAFELEDSERDYGHATVIELNKKWLITFNFIYNKKASQEHLMAAMEFLHAAESSLKESYLRSAIDSLHSASELAAKAFLLGSPDKTIIEAKSHDVVHRKINMQRKLGNVNSDHIDTFNNLKNLRSSARYLQTELTIQKAQVEEMFGDIKEFIENVSKLSEAKL